MFLNKRLIKSNDAGGGYPPTTNPDPSSLTLQSTGSLPGGTYRFVSFVLDRVNGGKFFYLRNGGVDLGRVSVATMTGFDVSTASLTQDSANFSLGYYTLVMGGSSDGTKVSTTGYQNSNNNQFISTYTIGTPFTAPSTFINSASRPYPGSNVLEFSSNGLKMYHANSSTGELYEYDLSTPFDPATGALNTIITYDSISTETFPTYPGVGWNGRQARWTSDGTTFYLLMEYFNGSTFGNMTLKAYNASAPFSVASLSERPLSTNLYISQLDGVPASGFNISDSGHFLFGRQMSNGGNQDLYMFA